MRAGIDRDVILRRAEELRARHPSLRHGQAVFHEASILYPDETDALVQRGIDCFHDDSRVAEFLEALTRIVEVAP